MTAQQTVETFIEAWNQMDWGRVVEMVSADCIYHNIPMQPVTGPEGVRAAIEKLGEIVDMDWEVLNIAAHGDVVLTERIDRFVLAGGKHIEIAVMGTFEVEEGKISAWRDYFDLGQYTAQMQAG